MLRSTCLLALLLAFSSVFAPLWAADPAFVGVLAVAADDEVAKQLGLSEEVKGKLLAIIDERENEAVELALQVKDLPPDQRQAKLAPFVAESEKRGLALLTEEQKTRLTQLRVARDGLASLQEPAISEAVGLTKTQQQHVKILLGDLNSKLAKATEAERRVARAETERQLAKILSTQQRAAWDKLAGIAGPGGKTPEAKPAAEKVATNSNDSKPDDAVKPETKANASTSAKANAQSRTADDAPPKDPENVRLTFNFSYTPYKDVLEWFAEQADLSLVGDVIPPGTFNYKDRKSYTPAQAIDVINGHLLVKGFTLVRRGRSLFVFNLEDGSIPPGFTEYVTPEELDSKGEYELLGCLFTFTKSTPEEVEADIRKLMGPQGSLIVLAKSKQMYIQETAGKLRTIRSVVEAMEDPASGKNDAIVVFNLEHALPDEVMAQARQLMGIPEGLSATPDGSFRLSIDTVRNRFLVTGRPDQIERFKKLVEMVDVDPGEGADVAPIESPQLEVYAITAADSDSVLQVLQALLAGQPNVRVSKDPKTGSIIAHATPSQHGTIKALIDQMQKDARQVEVIKLRKVDPQVAVIAIKNLFGVVEGTPNPAAPHVDADLNASQLFIRGSQAQIDQIRELLEKMGEEPTNGDSTPVERTYVRTIGGLTGRAQASALQQFEQIFGAYRPNKITIRTPTTSADEGVPTRVPVPKGFEKRTVPPTAGSQPRSDDSRSEGDRDRDDDRGERDYGRDRGYDRDRGDDRDRRDEDRRDEGRREEGRRTERSVGLPRYYVAWQEPELQSTEESRSPESAPATNGNAATSARPPKQKSVPGAEVVITVTPNGIVIASEDLDALDEAEELLREFMEQPTGKEYTIFYLRYAKADSATTLLQQALGGGGGGSDDGGGSIMGDLASSMLGGGGGMGSIMGSLMGGGGGGGSSVVSSGPVLLIADNRLNAIIAQGRPADLDLAEQLLKIIDQPMSPEDVQIIARPRFIPVLHTTADEMATVVRQVYSGRIAADPNQPRQPSPEDIVRALRGGRGGGGGGRQEQKSEEPKMTIGVDSRSNSLIVSAPDPLFEEVKMMVEQLDIAGSQVDEKVEIVSLGGASPQLMERSLSSMIENATVNVQTVGTTTASRSSRSNTSRNTSQSNNRSSGRGGNQNQQNTQAAQQQFTPQMQQEMQRRIQAFNQFQGGRGGPGGGFGGGGFGGGGGGRGGRGR